MRQQLAVIARVMRNHKSPARECPEMQNRIRYIGDGAVNRCKCGRAVDERGDLGVFRDFFGPLKKIFKAVSIR